MKQQILAMLELQNAMNSRVNENWAEQHFAWYRAIWVECAELLDHYGWKWWKKQTPDANQVKLELVDIWHFGLSILLLESRNHHGDIARLVERQLANAKPSGDFREDLEAFTLSTLQTKKFDVAGFGALMAGVGLSFARTTVTRMVATASSGVARKIMSTWWKRLRNLILVALNSRMISIRPCRTAMPTAPDPFGRLC